MFVPRGIDLPQSIGLRSESDKFECAELELRPRIEDDPERNCAPLIIADRVGHSCKVDIAVRCIEPLQIFQSPPYAFSVKNLTVLNWKLTSVLRLREGQRVLMGVQSFHALTALMPILGVGICS